jgi:hypothetical protein
VAVLVRVPEIVQVKFVASESDLIEHWVELKVNDVGVGPGLTGPENATLSEYTAASATPLLTIPRPSPPATAIIALLIRT